MNIIITYDISEGHPKDRHVEIKQQMIDKGYFKSYSSDNRFYDLPNTTLWKPDPTNILTPQTGLNDLNSAVHAINVKYNLTPPMKIEKAECVAFVIHLGIPRNT